MSGVTTDLAEYLVSERARLPCSTFDGDEALMLVNLQLSTGGPRCSIRASAWKVNTAQAPSPGDASAEHMAPRREGGGGDSGGSKETNACCTH